MKVNEKNKGQHTRPDRYRSNPSRPDRHVHRVQKGDYRGENLRAFRLPSMHTSMLNYNLVVCMVGGLTVLFLLVVTFLALQGTREAQNKVLDVGIIATTIGIGALVGLLGGIATNKAMGYVPCKHYESSGFFGRLTAAFVLTFTTVLGLTLLFLAISIIILLQGDLSDTQKQFFDTCTIITQLGVGIIFGLLGSSTMSIER